MNHDLKTRSAYGSQSDGDLISQCEVDTYRASGPGGQKRNKTSSAVRLRHLPTGLIVIAEESRSQHENKAKAVQRLRRAMYLIIREPVIPQNPELLQALDSDNRLNLPSTRNAKFWPAAAAVLDILAESQAQVSTAAEIIGTTTANLITFLEMDPHLWQEANRMRNMNGLSTLRPKA